MSRCIYGHISPILDQVLGMSLAGRRLEDAGAANEAGLLYIVNH